MTHMRKYTRLLAVVVQLLLFTTPLHADFNPTNPPEPNITNSLTVGVTPTEAGRVSGGGKYKQGTSVYISTSAYTNYKFLYWTINGYPYEQTKTSFYYTMGDSAVTFIAHYEYVEPTPEPFDPTNPPEPQIKQHLSVELDIEEGGYTRGTGNYKSGERVYVQAVLETNYELQYWTINGYPYSETNKSFYYVVGDTNAHFVAHIAEKHLLTLKTQPRAAGVSTMKMNGSQFSDMLVAPGKVIDFNTTKNEDYIFRYWTINGFTHTTETAFRYTMGDTTASVVAVYDYVGTGDTTVFNPGNPPEPELRENVTVVVLSADESKGTVSGGGTYLFGTLDTITATPIDGFTFRRWHDGNTETPRVIRAERDTVYIAYFGNDTVVWNDTICYGETLSVGDSLLAESGHYEFYTPRPDGLFTWNIVDLTVWHQMSSTLDATICAGESFIYEGVEYTQPGTYPLTLQNAFGCDSLVTLTLNVLPQVEDHEEHITICYGETYMWPVNGVTYDASTIVYDTTINANGCYSLNILYLTVLPQLQPIYDSITINDGSAATWNGVKYTKSGDYTTTLYDANECPQAAYLHLYISSTSYLDDAFCQGDIYTWQGHYHTDGTTPLTFTSAGTYTDTLADINGNDSICVLILEEVPMPNLVVRPDTTIHMGDSVLLWATGADYISWSPTEYITQTDELTSYATPIVTTTYTATGYNMPEGGGNLVYNGNFDLGNTGFVTDCNYFPPYTTPGSYGTYTVADDVQGFWYGYVESVKAYGGVGNMIIFDGYTTAHSVVWSQTVTVQPHTFYAFSAQVMSALDSHLEGQFALLQFAVNDEPVGPIFHSPDKLYTWEKFYNVWYSGDNTTAVLTIYNQNDNPFGNDFALDEIQFAQLHEGCEDSKTVTIAVISNSVVDTTVCASEVPFEWNGLSANTTGIYQATLASSSGLLDSIVTLNLTVLEPTFTTISDTICYGELYTWSINGETYHNSIVVSDTLADSNGCDSVITLHLTMLPEVPITIISDTICYGDTYTWATNGQTYSTSTTVYDTLSNSYACDSIVSLQLYVRPQVPLTEETIVVKFGETYTWHGTTYDASGDYSLTIPDSHGCDSTLVLHLTVLPETPVTEFNSFICDGDSLAWEGLTFTTSGDYSVTVQDANGYDSILIMHLTVLEPTFTTVSDTICYGESYTWLVNGETYHNSVVVSDTLADSNGCDSVITLHLTMLPEVPITIISDTICYGDTYTWATNGQTYSTSTTVYDTLSNSYTCDSIVVLQLYVRPQVPVTEETVVVKYGETYDWHGTTYDASGDYPLTILDSHGCDSTLVLHLTVLPETPVTEFSAFICEGDSLTWEGLSCTTSGDYSVTVQDANGYDSILIMHLTVLEPTFTTISDTICYGESYTWAENGKTYTKSATVSVQYSSIYGCDSTITLHLTVLPANTETVVTEQFCFHDTFIWPLNGKSYNTSATDTVTLLDRHGCDSVVILQLTQLPHHETIIEDTICYGDTYLWAENGQSYSSSVVDSIVLPDSNGCDSVIFLHLTMLPEIPQTIYQDTICQGDKYTWYLTGQTYTTITDTSVVLTNINGCDSVVRLMLYVRPIQETITNMTICYGESFEWEGNIYTTTTKRTLKYQDIYGCDSIVTLNLIVIPQIPTTTLYETICYGDTYVFAGQICDATATYTATLASKDGCDSTVTLHLTVLPEVPITQEYATICYGETYTWHAITYDASGDYTTTLLDANGCDSLITLHLTVLPEVPITEEYATICYGDTYTWHATTYNASGDYTTTLLDANGCDSLITLHLTVLPEVPITHLYDTICYGDTYIWQGTTYNTSGDYTTTLLDSNGCDSIVTLHLHVLQDIQPTQQHVSICYGETYVWNGAVYDQSGVYSTILTSVHGCDSIVKLILTVLPQNPITEETVSIASGTSYNWHGESYSVAGDYTTTLTDSHGCDSIVILHLQTVNSNLSVSTFEQCADDPFIEFYIDDYTTFRNIAFQWDEAAHSQHLHDTIVPVTGPYVSIPNTARAGEYNVQVSAVFNGQHFGAQSLTVTLLYPSSALDQHWDDFIGVLTHDYNGGYDFVSFQWYKDNEPLPGETRSYLSSALEFGASYSAMLEDANGVKLMTCPIIATPQTEISLYPSMLTPRQMIHIHTSQYATIQFFTLTGDLLYSTQQEPGEILVQAPDRTGLYIVQIMYHDNTNRVLTRKITVR